MTEIEWTFDSCQCIVIFESSDTSLVRVIQKCQLHKDSVDFFTTLKAHNATYNTLALMPERIAEYKRIKALGDPVKS